MKCRTKFQNKENNYEVYFAYEDYYGGEKFGFYDEMQKKGTIPNIENKHGTLVGYLHSYYWGVTERIHIQLLNGKPTISQIKEFMKDCYDFLEKLNKNKAETETLS